MSAKWMAKSYSENAGNHPNEVSVGIVVGPLGFVLGHLYRHSPSLSAFSRQPSLLSFFASELIKVWQEVKKLSENKLVCPVCGSSEAWKYGSRDYTTINYACKKCGAHYSEPWKPPKEGLKCPECCSQRLQRAGNHYTKDHRVQRWLCNECGYRFLEGIAKEERERPNVVWVCSVDHGIVCPRCGCKKVWKDGSYYPPFEEDVKVQRYFCSGCQRRFSKRELNKS